MAQARVAWRAWRACRAWRAWRAWRARGARVLRVACGMGVLQRWAVGESTQHPVQEMGHSLEGEGAGSAARACRRTCARATTQPRSMRGCSVGRCSAASGAPYAPYASTSIGAARSGGVRSRLKVSVTGIREPSRARMRRCSVCTAAVAAAAAAVGGVGASRDSRKPSRSR
eukprot:4200553-Prymnesium_polylepis.1